MRLVETMKRNARELKGLLTAIYYASNDVRIRLVPKLIIGAAILYALSPIDLVPDFIPVLGQLDDLIIVPALIALAVRLIPQEVFVEAKTRAAREPIKLKKNWAFGAVFICLWGFLIYLLIESALP